MGRGKFCTLPLTFQKSSLECVGYKGLPQLLRDCYPLLRGLGEACYAKAFAVGGSVTKKYAKMLGRGKFCTLPLTFRKSSLECAGSKGLPQLLEAIPAVFLTFAWAFDLT